MMHRSSGLLLVMITVGMGACGGGDDAATIDAAGAVDAAPDASSTCERLLLRGMLRQHDSLSGNGVAAVGAEVCAQGGDCTIVTASGAWALCVDPDADVALTFAKAGYATQVWPYTTGTVSPEAFDGLDGIYSDAINVAIYQDTAVIYPPTTLANLAVAVYVPGTRTGVADATFTFSPVEGVGPIYMGDNFVLDPGMTATGITGFAEVGNIPTGLYDVFVTHATRTSCSLKTGRWTSPTAGAAARIPAIAGFETYVFVDCAAP